MKQNSSKLQHREEQHIEAHQQSTQRQTAREFAGVEALLRYDAEQILPPPIVAKRLDESIAREAKPAQSWWRRFFPS